jgi:hypothetical protein
MIKDAQFSSISALHLVTPYFPTKVYICCIHTHIHKYVTNKQTYIHIGRHTYTHFNWVFLGKISVGLISECSTDYAGRNGGKLVQFYQNNYTLRARYSRIHISLAFQNYVNVAVFRQASSSLRKYWNA